MVTYKSILNPFTGKLQLLSDISSYFNYKGVLDCSLNPNYPAGLVGDIYVVSVAGKIGGAAGVDVNIGDLVVCKTAGPSGDQATVGMNWDIIESSTAAVHFDGTINVGDICKRTGTNTIGKVTAIPEGLIVPNDEILTFTNTQSAMKEVGDLVAAATFNWTMLRNAAANTSQTVSGPSLVGSPVSVAGALRTLAGTFSPSLGSASGTNTFTLNTVGDDAYADSKTNTIRFVYPIYYGVGADGLTGAQIRALTNLLAVPATVTLSFSPNAQRVYFAYPATSGNVTAIYDINNFDVTADFTMTLVNITGLDATVQSYKVYEIDHNVGVGLATTYRFVF